MTDGRWATSSLEWILLYEAFAAFQVKAESYGLYSEEIKRIEKGTCLLAAASNHVFINIQASRTEHDLITTDRKDLGRIARERAKMQEMQELYGIEEDNGEIF